MPADMDSSVLYQWPCPTSWSQSSWKSRSCDLPKHCEVDFGLLLELLHDFQTMARFCKDKDTDLAREGMGVGGGGGVFCRLHWEAGPRWEAGADEHIYSVSDVPWPHT